MNPLVQKIIAKRMGINTDATSGPSAGENNPMITVIMGLMEKFGIDPQAIIGYGNELKSTIDSTLGAINESLARIEDSQSRIEAKQVEIEANMRILLDDRFQEEQTREMIDSLPTDYAFNTIEVDLSKE